MVIMTLDSWSFIQTLLNICILYFCILYFWILFSDLSRITKISLNTQSSCMYDYYDYFAASYASFFRSLWKAALIFNSFVANKDINVRIKWLQWRTWQREADQPPAAQSLRIRTDDRLQSLSHTREQSGDHISEGQEVLRAQQEVTQSTLPSRPDLKAHYRQQQPSLEPHWFRVQEQEGGEAHGTSLLRRGKLRLYGWYREHFINWRKTVMYETKQTD